MLGLECCLKGRQKQGDQLCHRLVKCNAHPLTLYHWYSPNVNPVDYSWTVEHDSLIPIGIPQGVAAAPAVILKLQI